MFALHRLKGDLSQHPKTLQLDTDTQKSSFLLLAFGEKCFKKQTLEVQKYIEVLDCFISVLTMVFSLLHQTIHMLLEVGNLGNKYIMCI